MLSERSLRRAALPLAALLLLGAACTPPPDPPADPPPAAVDTPSAPPFTVVAEGQMGPFGAAETVFRDRAEWEAAGVPSQMEPDFDGGAVLLASVEAPSGGYRVRFDRVETEGTAAVAHYTVLEPGDSCMTTQALTTPFQAVAVRGLPEGEVRFVERRERYACE